MPAVYLNEAQLGVLRWIASGSPPGVMEGYAHRISASALRTRDLVRISGRGAKWRAELTDRGREQLEALERGQPAAHPKGSRSAHPRLPRRRGEPQARTEAAAHPLSKTEQLVADVLTAGGRLTLPDETDSGGVNWRQRAYAAQRHGKVPAGMRLSVCVTSAGFEIALLEGDTGNELGAEAVPVPTRLAKYHPVADEFRDRADLHEVSRKALPRVSRIVHALAKEAERRGHAVSCISMRTDSYGRSWKPSQDGQLLFTINGHVLKVRIWEKGAGLRGPYERDSKRWQEDRDKPFRQRLYLQRPKPYDSGATGELNIEALGWSQGRQTRWGDRQRWTLEDRLPQLMRELETQAVEAAERRDAKEREEAAKQRLWEAAMERAKHRLVDAHRLEILRERVRAWSEADAIRAYCDAVEARHGTDAVSSDPDAAQWLALARAYAHHVQDLPRMPVDPEPTPEALKPHLDGWSPYGPRRWP